MNHSRKVKNFSRTAAHRKSMFAGMLDDFKRNGHLTTTIAKAKYLQQILQKEIDEKIMLVRIENRKGDNALMAKIVSEDYLRRKFGEEKV